MTAEQILAWWNLIYVLPFLLALVYLIVYAASGLTFGEAGAGAELDAGAEADAGVDADAGADGGADAGAETDGHTPVLAHDHAAPDLPFFLRVMSALGAREVPLSIVLMVLLFAWGIVGFATNQIVRPILPFGWMAALVSLPAAVAGSILVTRGVAKAVARWFPTTETYVRRKADLIGCLGEAIFAIDRASGTASVRDRQGDLFQVTCRTYEDGQPIAKGRRVLLIDYDPKAALFYVKESNLTN